MFTTYLPLFFVDYLIQGTSAAAFGVGGGETSVGDKYNVWFAKFMTLLFFFLHHDILSILYSTH